MSTSSSLSRNWAPLSLPIDSRLQLDVTNGSDLGLGSDSTVGDGFDLAPSSMAYSSVLSAFEQLRLCNLMMKDQRGLLRVCIAPDS
ncbi:hypothetical protein CFP56_026031 [Quercus suber]|uniref:Uncharacterized protein n=1 Tax=Quercus suber TaxID=58331 RepID=A0AAW0K2F8_QUESU